MQQPIWPYMKVYGMSRRLLSAAATIGRLHQDATVQQRTRGTI